jgi:hypothetical protein
MGEKELAGTTAVWFILAKYDLGVDLKFQDREVTC